jgi:large subunit ribosomal protein L7/L12
MENKKVKDIISEIGKMNILEISELVKALEDEFGVKASSQVQVVSSSNGDGNSGQQDSSQGQEAKDSFDVILESAGDKKIEVIKAIRSINPELGLKEAKDITEATPKALKESVNKEEADKIKKLFEEVGATITLK